LFVFRTRLFSTQDVGLAYVTFYHNSLLWYTKNFF
jgi:hypothetical protein